MTPYVLAFAEIGIDDVPSVGGKNASLGEMVRSLGSQGVRVPDGFAVTAEAWRTFVRHNGLEATFADALAGLDLADVADLQRRGQRIREAVLAAQIPPAIATPVLDAYTRLGDGRAIDVAVRSSATAEDLPDASFAGQQETYLNVRGGPALLQTLQRCYASLFTDRAISYRAQHGYTSLEVALSVGVQRMVRSDVGAAGVMFTIDPESGFRDAVVISAAWGLGETVVQGSVVPDEYVVFKPTLSTGHRPVLRRALGSKEIQLVYDAGGGRMTKITPVPEVDRARFVLSDDEILDLARQAVIVEAHYTARNGHPTPMDLEWAKDGITGELFIVQARPETVQSRKSSSSERYVLDGTAPTVLTGQAVGERIGAGPVRIVKSVDDMAAFQEGDILVAERTDPDWEPVMRKAAAIVTARGGRTCHAAIVSRELGVPALVGAAQALELLIPGQPYTVSCAHGEIGRVLQGMVAFHVDQQDPLPTPPHRTPILLNVGNPQEAFRLSFLPNDGVGLARIEFVVSAIGIHPMALLEFDSLPSELKTAIDAKTKGWSDKADYFVQRLAEGVGTIAAAFYPKPVIVRLSDFKSNEYAGLLGGERYEPHEENPMLGLRGAARYDHPTYRAAFALECRAMRIVRDQMGLTNVKLMVPFCRTVSEGRRVLDRMAENGLVRGERGLEVYVMCEIPSNAILAEAFAQIFDGF